MAQSLAPGGRPSGLRAARGLPGLASAALLVVAVLLGVYADVGQEVDGVLGTVPELGTPWLLLAFAGGHAWARHPVVALLSGPALIALGLVSYWVFVESVHGTPIYNLTNDGRGTFWLGAAAVLGLAGAAAGLSAAATRASWRSAGWGLATAVPVAEAARVVVSDLGPEPLLLAAALVVAAALLLATGARRAPWWGVAACALVWAAAGAVAATQVLPALR